jgi:hypothetical protein
MDYCTTGQWPDRDLDDQPDFQRYFDEARGQVPYTPIRRFVEPAGGLLERSGGYYNLIPGRVVSSQTRLKNMAYEYPAYGWTMNPESPPWVPSVPATGKFIVLNSTSNFSTQHSFLQPTGALTMQSEQTWLTRIQNFFSPQAVSQSQSVGTGTNNGVYMNSYGFGTDNG